MRSRLVTTAGLAVGIALGLAASYLPSSEAARNASGTYSLPAGNPVVSGTTITSSWANTTLADLRTEMTASLDRNGKGCMLAPLCSTAGTVSAPAIFTSGDTNTGMYHPAADQWALACGGAQVQAWTTSGTTITGSATVTAGVTVTNSAASGKGIQSTGSGSESGITSYGGATQGTGVVAVGGGQTGMGVSAQGAASVDGGVGGAGIDAVGGSGAVGGVFSGGAGAVGLTAAGGSASVGMTGTGASGYAGGSFANGTDATAATRQDALTLTNGDLDLSSVANPNSNVAVANRLTPKNIIKAWGAMSEGADGGAQLDDGFNVVSVACSSPSTIVITFAQDMASVNYITIANIDYAGSTVHCEAGNRLAGTQQCTIAGSGDCGDVSGFITIGAQ